MADIESVIEALRICTDESRRICYGCPYYSYDALCVKKLMGDAFEIITKYSGKEKEDEEV